MNRTLLASLLGAAALAPLAAHAQTAGYTYQIGAVRPMDTSTRNATQDAGLALGLGVLTPNQGGNGGSYSVEGFYTRAAGNGNSLQTIGGYVMQRLPIPTNLGGFGLYYGGGVGLVQARFKGLSEVGETATTASANKVGLSYRFVAGLRLGGSLTTELGYTINPSVNFNASKVKSNTLTLTIGKAY